MLTLFHPPQPTIQPFLQAWDLRLDVILTLLIAGTLYVSGWLRLRRAGHTALAGGWRLAAYLSGLLVIALALMSGIDTYQSYLFTMHMVQHILLTMIAPPLLLLANPMPVSIWGLPRRLRLQTRHLFARNAAFRQGLKALTSPFIAWGLYVSVYWGWHDPNAYNLALRNPVVHDVEHISFFLSAMLFWWHVIAAAPQIHGRLPYGTRVLYVLLTFFINEAASVAIALAPAVIFTHYLDVPRIWGMTALQDQSIGGGIMWIVGGMMYVVAELVLIIRLMSHEEHAAHKAAAHRATASAA